MMKRVLPWALSLLVLTACEPPGGMHGSVDEQAGSIQKATISLSMSSVNRLKTVSAYRLQDLSEPSSGVTDFTPESYRVTIASIMLVGSDGRNVEIYQGREPVELGDQASVETALNAAALPVEPGTYVGAYIRLGEIHEIQGQAQLGTQTVYTKSSSGEDAKVAPAELTPIAAGGDRALDFAAPVTIKEGENVKLSLVYDLTDAVNFYPQVHSDGFAYSGGEGIELKYIPFFAFVGEPPKPEIYKVTIADTEAVKVVQDDEWHYQMVLFPKENGELAGLQCIGRIDEGYSGSHFNAINFVNNRLDVHRLNTDGSYHLIGHKEGGGAFPMYEVQAFKRGDHAGKVLFFDPYQEPRWEAPVELDYQAIKLQ